MTDPDLSRPRPRREPRHTTVLRLIGTCGAVGALLVGLVAWVLGYALWPGLLVAALVFFGTAAADAAWDELDEARARGEQRGERPW